MAIIFRYVCTHLYARTQTETDTHTPPPHTHLPLSSLGLSNRSGRILAKQDLIHVLANHLLEPSGPGYSWLDPGSCNENPCPQPEGLIPYGYRGFV